jgi:sugar phosphate permease
MNPSQQGASHAPRPTRFRFVIVSLLFLMAVVNYIDRGALSYASEQVIARFGFNKAEWGAVLGYFGYGYMFGALCGGTLSDYWGPRRVWIAACIAWSAFEAGTAFAGEFGLTMLGGSALAGFAVMRVLFGFAEGPAFSIINKTVSGWAAPRERALISSAALASTPVGAMITAPIAVGLLVGTGDWRVAFLILGVVSVVILALFARTFTDKPEDSPHVNAAELAHIRSQGAGGAPGRTDEDEPRERPSLAAFFTSRTLVMNAVGYFAFLYVTFLLLTWTPKYLQNQFNYSLSSLWYIGMIPWVGSCVAVLLGGRISDWLLARTRSLRIARSWFAALSLLLSGLCFLSIPLATSPAGVIALMTLANTLNTLPNAVYWTVVIDTSPTSRVGGYSGITHFIANISSVVAPTLTGYLVNGNGYNSMFVAAGAVTLAGTLAMLLVKPGVFGNKREAAPLASAAA